MQVYKPVYRVMKIHVLLPFSHSMHYRSWVVGCRLETRWHEEALFIFTYIYKGITVILIWTGNKNARMFMKIQHPQI